MPRGQIPRTRASLKGVLVWTIGVLTIILVCSIMLITVGPVGHLYRDYQLFRSYENLESDLKTTLPVGTEYDMIVKYLEQRGIGYSYDEQTRSIYGVTKEFPIDILVNKSYSIVIGLDESRRLVSIRVKPVLVGP